MTRRNQEQYELAGTLWAKLLVLRANPAKDAIPRLAQLADRAQIKAGEVALESEARLRDVRASAWLAICGLRKEIETNPGSDKLDELWVDAQDKLKSWERAAE